ncbi:MAG: SCP2 sterol-binding domain-containing protein [Thiogranum sp.]|nr:SCP2 sterol-binding domain-containing protein [Thiogranum sp.]
MSLSAAIETALNLYIKRDPQALQRCTALEGKVIGIEITGLDLKLYFLPHSQGIDVLGHYEGDVDTLLSGSPLGFARLSLGRKEVALFEGAVTIQGDTETGQEFQDILARSEWDWEEQLSRVTGDAVAHQAGNLARRIRRYFDASRDTLRQDISEYLQEEARVLPSRVEVDDFLASVDGVRADTDRLAARVQRLAQKAESDT